MIKPRFLALMALSCAAVFSHAQAAQYPEKPIRLIVPYAVGGSTDTLARVVGKSLSDVLGQPIVVENKPGAGGGIGSAYAAKQPADGYTLVMAVESSHAVNPNAYISIPYDPIRDFAPISNLVDVPGVLVVNPKIQQQDLPAFITYLKANPQKLAFGSSGNGGFSHLCGEMFMHLTGTQMLHAPYKGLGPALTDLVAGHITVLFDTMTTSAPLIQAGSIRALAIGAKQRLKSFPDIPTYAEVGLPDMSQPTWFGLAAPAGTPDAILEKLNLAVREALKDPGTVAIIEKQGGLASPMSRDEFAGLLKTSYDRWKTTTEAINFKKM